LLLDLFDVPLLSVPRVSMLRGAVAQARDGEEGDVEQVKQQELQVIQ
jgi:hypothetical protein